MAKRKKKKARRAARPRKKAAASRRGVIRRRSPARRSARSRNDTKRGNGKFGVEGFIIPRNGAAPFYVYMTESLGGDVSFTKSITGAKHYGSAKLAEARASFYKKVGGLPAGLHHLRAIKL
jgi:hypothetical protein